MKNVTKFMIIMRIIYSVFKTFILIFINIYLWQKGKSIQTVAVFNIFNYIAATVSFYIGNIIALKNIKYNYILSSLSFIMAFALTAILGDKVASYAIVIGILGGFGDGFFFFNLNIFQADELDKEEMDHFMSIIGGVNKASAIVTPIVSGIIIERLGFIYMIYFLLMLVTVQLVLSFKMPSKKINTVGKVDISKTFKRTEYSKILWTNMSKSPYQQFTNMANSVFLFSLLTSETIIGFLNSSFAIFSILMFALYRYVIKFMHRKKAMLYGAIASSIVVILLVRPNLITFIIFGAMISIGNAFFNTPMVGVQLHSAKVFSKDQSELLGNLIHRVIMLNIGRVIFFGLMYLFYVDFTSPIFIIFLVYNLFSPMLTYYLAKDVI